MLGSPDVEAVLAWSAGRRDELPWRQTRDPWAVLVSELMLQQTQVARVVPRWHQFLERFPSASACANAPVGDVVTEWAGLGYNRRAVNLHRAAVAVVAQHGGVVPDDLEALLALPGLGPYTARAVLAFAYEQDVAVVDTNVGRILARQRGERLTHESLRHLQTTSFRSEWVGRGIRECSIWAHWCAQSALPNAISVQRHRRVRG